MAQMLSLTGSAGSSCVTVSQTAQQAIRICKRPGCGKSIEGRADRVYHSNACGVAHERERKIGSTEPSVRDGDGREVSFIPSRPLPGHEALLPRRANESDRAYMDRWC